MHATRGPGSTHLTVGAVPPLRDVAHLDRVVEHLADALVTEAEGVDAVALTLEAPGAPLGCRVATLPLARELCRLQRSTGEGPSVDALRTGRPVYVARGRFEPWSTYAPGALARGLRLHAAAPLPAGPGARGVLTAYGVHLDDLDARSRRLVHDLARTLGARVAELVARGPDGDVARPQPSRDERAETAERQRRRRLVDRAVGIVQERYGTSAERALELLESSAARQHVRLDAVAQHVVEQAERWGGPVPRPRRR